MERENLHTGGYYYKMDTRTNSKNPPRGPLGQLDYNVEQKTSTKAHSKQDATQKFSTQIPTIPKDYFESHDNFIVSEYHQILPSRKSTACFKNTSFFEQEGKSISFNLSSDNHQIEKLNHNTSPLDAYFNRKKAAKERTTIGATSSREQNTLRLSLRKINPTSTSFSYTKSAGPSANNKTFETPPSRGRLLNQSVQPSKFDTLSRSFSSKRAQSIETPLKLHDWRKLSLQKSDKTPVNLERTSDTIISQDSLGSSLKKLNPKRDSSEKLTVKPYSTILTNSAKESKESSQRTSLTREKASFFDAALGVKGTKETKSKKPKEKSGDCEEKPKTDNLFAKSTEMISKLTEAYETEKHLQQRATEESMSFPSQNDFLKEINILTQTIKEEKQKIFDDLEKMSQKLTKYKVAYKRMKKKYSHLQSASNTARELEQKNETQILNTIELKNASELIEKQNDRSTTLQDPETSIKVCLDASLLRNYPENSFNIQEMHDHVEKIVTCNSLDLKDISPKLHCINPPEHLNLSTLPGAASIIKELGFDFQYFQAEKNCLVENDCSEITSDQTIKTMKELLTHMYKKLKFEEKQRLATEEQVNVMLSSMQKAVVNAEEKYRNQSKRIDMSTTLDNNKSCITQNETC